MSRFIDKILMNKDKDKVEGHNLYWEIIYSNPYSHYDVDYTINFKNNWTKVRLDVNRCILSIDNTIFYVDSFKFAEDLICSYAIANDLTISEENQSKNIIRKLKIEEIFGL